MIALQINNWNQDRADKIKESKYIKDLITDLRIDSIKLESLSWKLYQVTQSKRRIESFLNGTQTVIDSLGFHIFIQIDPTRVFEPLNTTMEEMKNAGGLAIIRDDQIRRKIVELYNNYSIRNKTSEQVLRKEIKLEESFYSLVENIINIPDPEAAKILREQNEIANMIRYNLLFLQYRESQESLKECSTLISNLVSYLDE